MLISALMLFVLFVMFLHCSSIHPSFAAVIFILTSLFTSLYSSPVSVLVYFRCFSSRLWSHSSRTSFVTQGWIFFLRLPRACSAVERSTSFRLFARMSSSLSRTQRVANFLSTLAWDLRYFRVFEFPKVKSDARTLRKELGFQLQLGLSTRSWSLPMSAPGKDLVFALLMLDLGIWGVRMKSIWLWSCPSGACQVTVLGNLWGWRVLPRVSRWFFENSRNLHSLSFVSPKPIFLLSLPGIGMRHGLLWHSNRLEV